MALDLVPARTLRQFLAVRKIRNDCCRYMTRNNSPVSVYGQVKFWWRHRKPHPLYCVYVGYTEKGTPVAYGIVDNHVVSGGILRWYRGHGLGRELFEYLTQKAASPALLEVLSSNVRAQDLYGSLGYAQYAMRGNVISMRHTETKRVVRPSNRKEAPA